MTQQIFYRSGANNRKVPIGKFPMQKFFLCREISYIGVAPLPKTGLANIEFCIGKFPTGRSGAASKTGLAHREFPYMEILHRETPYREKWRHF